MIKVSSITDVITNSSMEVFTLRESSMTLEELKTWLSENVTDYAEPEIMRKDSGVLKDLIDFGYVVDPEDKESMDRWWIKVFTTPVNHWMDLDWNEHTEPIEGGPEINKAWMKFLVDNRDRINSEHHLKYPGTKYNPVPNDVEIEEIDIPKGWWKGQVHAHFLPSGIVQEFLSQYQGIIPESSKIPPEENADEYVRKLGFSETDENEMPYEFYDKITEEVGAQEFHLG